MDTKKKNEDISSVGDKQSGEEPATKAKGVEFSEQTRFAIALEARILCGLIPGGRFTPLGH
jgi:hypothetical protein